MAILQEQHAQLQGLLYIFQPDDFELQSACEHAVYRSKHELLYIPVGAGVARYELLFISPKQ